MIQRIQSIYLLLGALALLALLLFDEVWANPAVATYVWFGPVLLVLTAGTAAIAIAAIFMYKDRKKQLKVVVWTQIATLLLTAFLFGVLFIAGALQNFTEAGGGGLVVLALPVLAYLFFFLARRSIQADIDLVRSMDRLR